ncbi:hypothetical protein [Variovorax paradoxus]|jgi:hypothetical protein|uniref:Uncharacterized protein n=1 Tax=Variovorax paradoxus TaxID=34073 RepID=A0A679JM48_VARPD|nr:hypothetical protein VVAX_04931 [Variovorax paradoxus]
MRTNVTMPMPFDCEAAACTRQPARRWWLGWMQLLCAWVLCMLLCANIALVLAQGLPEGARDQTREKVSGKPVGCAVTGSPAQHGPVQVERAGPMKESMTSCRVIGG